MRTILLLAASNLFMTIAWYGHLKFKHVSLVTAILVSWLIALPEYALQVPANRWGHGTFTVFQLKILQEIITLVVFTGFALLWLREPLKWNHVAAFVLLVGAVACAFWPSPRIL